MKNLKFFLILSIFLIAPINIYSSYASLPLKTVQLTLHVFDNITGLEIESYQLSLKVLGAWNKTYSINEINATIVAPYDERDVVVTISCEGYEDTSQITKLNEDKTLTFYLMSLNPTIVYVSVKNMRNELIQDATVSVQATKGNETLTGKTDTDGKVSFECRYINYEISVFANNYETFKGSMIVLHDNSIMIYNVTLNDLYTTTLTIIVQDSSGKRLSGAHVNLISEYADFSGATDKDGMLSLAVPCTSYVVTVSLGGYGTFQGHLNIVNMPNPSPVEYNVELTGLPWWQPLSDFASFMLGTFGYAGSAVLVATPFAIAYFVRRRMHMKRSKPQKGVATN